MTHLRHTADRTTALTTPDGAELRVRTRGPRDAPATALLAHGWALTSDTWSAVASLLAAAGGGAVRVVRWDHRGHGASTRGTAPLTMAQLAADTALVAQEEGGSGRLVLAGHSLGAMAVAALAAERPELFAGQPGGGGRVGGVLLACGSATALDTSAAGFAPAERAAGAAVRTGMAVLRGLAGPADAVHTRLPPHLRAYRAAVRRALFGPEAQDTDVAAVAAQLHTAQAQTVGEAHAAMSGHDVRGRLGALAAVPAVLLAGEHDPVVPERHLRALAAELPHARVHTAQGAGHMVPLERPEETAGLLAELCRVP
ncbi:alpha/beta fold hydrolase [Nocardiopsis coralliicola]